ncbi:MAG: nucleotidyltransferase family protein [Actinobacteria bacterium]|nr:MAG: nucleotidyltransferase family protein [Actinomycetota bacterium]
MSGIVLAAGTGSRFGGTKQLAELDGSPLVMHAVTALREGGVDEIVVVTGHDADAVEAVLPAEVRAVRNPSFRDGQVETFRATRARIARLRFTDAPGPSLLSREIYADAGHLHGDAGARVLIASHPEWVEDVPIDRPVPRDVDTPEDLAF